MDVMAGLSAVSTALDIAKKLKEFDKRLGDAEFKLRISELMMSLADAKVALSEAKLSLLAKNEEIASLKKKDRARFRTVSYRGYSFGIDDSGKSIGRPFCPVCEARGLQIQLTRVTSTKDLCPSCKAPYGGHPYMLPSDFVIPAA